MLLLLLASIKVTKDSQLNHGKNPTQIGVIRLSRKGSIGYLNARFLYLYVLKKEYWTSVGAF